MNENNTARIYEVLNILKGLERDEFRDALHEAWPVPFQLTTMTNDNYQRFLRNLKRILYEKEFCRNVASLHIVRGELPPEGRVK